MAEKLDYNIAIAGNPNSGKTTLFNALTGARHQVGNYPGVTVEKREGLVKRQAHRLNAVDLPGTYSLTAYSEEELVARNYLVEERPHVVIDVINAASLERNLYLALQLLELGIPVVLALNMMDEVRKQGKTIDSAKLSQLLGVPVVETVARSGQGKQELIDQAVAFAQKRDRRWEPRRISYGPDLDPVLDEMTGLIEKEHFLTDQYPARWVALKYLEQDIQIMDLGRKAGNDLARQLSAMVDRVGHHCRTTLDTDPEAIIADYRYGTIASLLKQGVLTRDGRAARIAYSDKIDLVLTNRFLGPVIMFGIFYAMFLITFSLGEFPMSWLENCFGWLGDTASAVIPEGHLRSLVVSGVIAGVGGVVGFVPLIVIMFFMIAFMEDSGYMARMAYMLDRVLRIFGLHGSSVMPFIVSGGIPGGCAVPGVMAARTLRSPKEKIATLMAAPFMTCGAKVPVFLLLSAAFFQESAAVAMFWICLGGWVAALLVSRLLRSTLIRGEATPFVMELPPYRLPTLRGILIHTWERAWQYLKKAGTVILAISVLLWAAMTFPGLPQGKTALFDAERAALKTERTAASGDEMKAALEAELASVDNRQAQAALRHSLAGRLGIALEPVTGLAGFDWRTNIALLGGFAAKEVIVSSLGTAYSLGEVDPEETGSLSKRLQGDPQWNRVTAVSLIIFVLLYAPCFITVVVIARESSWKWAGFAVVFNTLLAFALSVLVYQAGTALL